MYDNRSAGELNLDAWNDVRGVVRKYDYIDIEKGMREQLKTLMKAKIERLETTLISRIKYSSDLATLTDKLSDLKKNDIKFIVNLFSFEFPLQDYQIVTQACDVCHNFNGLFNRVKEHEKGTLNNVHITQGELYSLYWLKQNKQKLKELVHYDYKYMVDEAKAERAESAPIEVV